MQDSKIKVSDNSIGLNNLKQNAKILRRICINKKFKDLSRKTNSIQKNLEECESIPSDDVLTDFRKGLFDIAFDMDKRLERDSSRLDENFSFSVMFT
jgi:hypothetical protein